MTADVDENEHAFVVSKFVDQQQITSNMAFAIRSKFSSQLMIFVICIKCLTSCKCQDHLVYFALKTWLESPGLLQLSKCPLELSRANNAVHFGIITPSKHCERRTLFQIGRAHV